MDGSKLLAQRALDIAKERGIECKQYVMGSGNAFGRLMAAMRRGDLRTVISGPDSGALFVVVILVATFMVRAPTRLRPAFAHPVAVIGLVAVLMVLRRSGAAGPVDRLLPYVAVAVAGFYLREKFAKQTQTKKHVEPEVAPQPKTSEKVLAELKQLRRSQDRVQHISQKHSSELQNVAEKIIAKVDEQDIQNSELVTRALTRVADTMQEGGGVQPMISQCGMDTIPFLLVEYGPYADPKIDEVTKMMLGSISEINEKIARVNLCRIAPDTVADMSATIGAAQNQVGGGDPDSCVEDLRNVHYKLDQIWNAVSQSYADPAHTQEPQLALPAPETSMDMDVESENEVPDEPEYPDAETESSVDMDMVSIDDDADAVIPQQAESPSVYNQVAEQDAETIDMVIRETQQDGGSEQIKEVNKKARKLRAQYLDLPPEQRRRAIREIVRAKVAARRREGRVEQTGGYAAPDSYGSYIPLSSVPETPVMPTSFQCTPKFDVTDQYSHGFTHGTCSQTPYNFVGLRSTMPNESCKSRCTLIGGDENVIEQEDAQVEEAPMTPDVPLNATRVIHRAF